MNFLLPLEIGLFEGLIYMWAVLSFAMAFRLLHFPDLTVEGSVPLGAAVFAVGVKGGAHPVLALGLAMLAGAAAGALTAALHTRFKVNAFLAGIIVVSIIYTVMLRLMGGSNVSLLNHTTLFDLIPADAADRRAVSIGALIALGGVGLLGLRSFFTTRLGAQVRAAGSNPQFCANVELPAARLVVAGLAGCNAFAGLTGALMASSQAFADVGGGQGALIIALAALAIGEAVVPGRRLRFPTFVLVAATTGTLAYYTVVAFAVQAGLAASDLRLATALMVLVMVAARARRDLDYQGMGSLA